MNYKENAEIVKKYLDDHDWHYDTKETESAIVFSGGVGAPRGVFSSFKFVVLVEDDIVQNITTLPVSMRDKLAEGAEYVARVNYPLKRGRMNMDFRDGEVNFHFAVPMAAVKADTDEVLSELLCLPGAMLAKYGDGIAKILFNGADPKTAYEQCDD